MNAKILAFHDAQAPEIVSVMKILKRDINIPILEKDIWKVVKQLFETGLKVNHNPTIIWIDKGNFKQR